MAKIHKEKIGAWGPGSEQIQDVLDLDEVVRELNREFKTSPERWQSMGIDPKRGVEWMDGKTSLTLEELSRIVACSGVNASKFFSYHPQVSGADKVIPIKEVFIRHLVSAWTTEQARSYLKDTIRVQEMGIHSQVASVLSSTIDAFAKHEGKVKIKEEGKIFSGQKKHLYRSTED